MGKKVKICVQIFMVTTMIIMAPNPEGGGIYCFWCGSRGRQGRRGRPLFRFRALSSEPVDVF